MIVATLLAYLLLLRALLYCCRWHYTHNRQCCGVGQYVNADARVSHTCAVCNNATMACGNGGITVRTLPLQSGYWRESFDSDKVRQCWNTAACKGGAPAAKVLGAQLSRDDYCNAGYEGPCECANQLSNTLCAAAARAC
jgi:hypothetical protein